MGVRWHGIGEKKGVFVIAVWQEQPHLTPYADLLEFDQDICEKDTIGGG